MVKDFLEEIQSRVMSLDYIVDIIKSQQSCFSLLPEDIIQFIAEQHASLIVFVILKLTFAKLQKNVL